MGAHPLAPSAVRVGGRWVSLPDLIRDAPAAVLGGRPRQDGELPFLFKVLAAEQPLSIQAHPNREQARAGFAREDRLGIARDDPQRNYRDQNPKPEVLYALQPFHMLRGFRSGDDILERCARLGLGKILPFLEVLERPGSDGLRELISTCLSLPSHHLAPILERVLAHLETAATRDDVTSWILELARIYPGDPGILFPLFLHLIELRPGQAIYTGPGILHAYLRGVGIELMASSDNVLRGGLTSKHVDIPQLLAVLSFEPTAPKPLSPHREGGAVCFLTPEGELALTVIDVSPGKPYENPVVSGAEILLCHRGHGMIESPGSKNGLTFGQGEALLVPAVAERYRILGDGSLFRASSTVRAALGIGIGIGTGV